MKIYLESDDSAKIVKNIAITTVMLACLLVGSVLAQHYKHTRVLGAEEGLAKPVTAPQEEHGHFVQEPSDRTSYRPDFSSALRRANLRSNYAMLRAFNEAVSDARLSTVLLTLNGEQIALGAIVDSAGWIVTKASQIPFKGEVMCQLHDRSRWPAQIMRRIVDVDLALIKIDRAGLPAIQWDASQIPPRGSWLATTDVDKMPSAVGVVSAGAQSIQPSKAVLGVEVAESTAGAAIVRVLLGTGAYEAGLRVGDNIVAVNGVPVHSHNELQSALNHAKPAQGGQVVRLEIERGERTFEADVCLMDLSQELLLETEMEVNGPISARATGFNRVFLHDTVLEPNQCGGPLCNLDGKVVGLNIARAGRVASYALPADVVRPVLEGLISQFTSEQTPARLSNVK